ncbi:YebC/PmpR family DNA-binding transcriptional regulator [Saccharicrinis fermentans]|uniref:Probable transcriptional regulatory protein JCM21142_83196 n=1 Tax=Saccharicrinis fermentans DSM 9555 = JCM 21142 TaxID=869213 RepID=W7YA96_9BACT|nr:YebC/PmpR family DNA-binding transcriptional regulator [Saccharicrinis fermentans]GAF04488.1 putative transcriptional regulatory protein [Saccharicrinis fermentans DSM 9555 = JCM 21142]
MGRAFEYRKATKMKRWAGMAKTFTKLGRQITMAAKDSGPDPESNPRLRMLIQNAKAANMPKDNVERAIKKATEKNTDDWKEIVYEGYGPFGIAVLVETTTNNNTRTVGAVRSYFSKAGGSLGTTGSVEYMFERKCHFKVESKEGLDLEELELEMIDAGANEIFEEDGKIIIYGEFESYGSIQSFLEENDFEIISSEFERFPTTTKKLSEEEVAVFEKMLGKFDEDDDVTNVYHTAEGL